ncbi:MAG: hypothetical protein ACR2PG_22805 [Hyphomicrobiaceae bacterium]
MGTAVQAKVAKPTCMVLNKLWQEKYVAAFNVRGVATGAFECPSVQATMAETFYWLDHWQQAVPKSKINFYDLALKYTKETKYSQSPRHRGIFMFSGGTTVYFTRQFVRVTNDVAKNPLLKAATFMHEVRHAMPDGTPHVTCTRGRYNGYAGLCDERVYVNEPTERGRAYSLEFAYIAWAYKNARALGVSRRYARRYGCRTLRNRFNHVDRKLIKKWCR